MAIDQKGFFEQATSGRNEWWLYIVTFLLVIVGYTIGQIPLTILQMSKVSELDLGLDALKRFEETMDFSIFGIDKNVGFIFLILIFCVATIGLFAGLRLHKRSFKDIITPKKAIDYKKILFAFGFWFALGILFETITYFIDPSHYTFSFNGGSFLILVLICILLLPIQTSFEEFFFRGYLMPGFSLLTKNKWLPLIITSVLFSLVHSANPEIDKYGFWTMQFYYIGAGLFFGYITIMDDSLELALGVHAATNVFGAAIVSYDGSVLQTDTLAKTSVINPWMMTVVFYISAIIFIIYCHKKYKWGGLSVLMAPINGTQDNAFYNLQPGNTPTTIPIPDQISNNFFPTDSGGIESNTDYSSLINENEEE